MITFSGKELFNLQDAVFLPEREGITELNIHGVSIDSRTTQSDDIFIAIRGENFDGHNYVKQAVDNGAKCLLVNKEWDEKKESSCIGIPVVKVKDTTDALLELGGIYRSRFPVPIVAITGTNGKTTTKELTYSVLSKKMPGLKSPGNFNNRIGVPLSIFQSENFHEFIVLEMGTNHFGEIRELSEAVNPDFGVITNIGPGHLESFKSLEGVAKAKAEIMSGMPANGTVVVPFEEPLLNPYLKNYNNILTFGFSDEADLSGKIIKYHNDGTCTFRLNNRFDVRLKLPGKVNVLNSLAAAAAGCIFNMSIETIIEGLEEFDGLKNRLNVTDMNEIKLINDSYNSNPESLKVALEFLNEYSNKIDGRSVAVIGDMLELGDNSSQMHSEAGELIAALELDLLIGYGNQTKYLVDAAKNSGMELGYYFSEKPEAAVSLRKMLLPGDVVLIKGSRGMQMESFIWDIQNWIALQDNHMESH